MARVDVVPNRLARVGGQLAAREAIERKQRVAERDVEPGSPAELRAVPVIGRGVSGAIPGTRPDTAPLR